ncbi:MAG: phenylalanine--tRNA ligase subunit alpha [Candidatus Sumerlaeia bacterium]|nr:phenylalanine--tRNA ligase subunit alpha [Candidatus Sumerlaeia bacterium]
MAVRRTQSSGNGEPPGDLLTQLDSIRSEALAAVEAAGSVSACDEVRIRYLAKKGPIQDVMKLMGKLGSDERPAVGERANAVRDAITEALAARRATLAKSERAARLEAEFIDITLPGTPRPLGSIHPITRTIQEVSHIFRGLGFSVAEGPEVEDDWHNFEALNIPADHPARDMHDTLYLAGSPLLLRTHTSPVQIRAMMSQPPPLAIICPGKTYRRDQIDATHSAMFHQIEGLLVGKDVAFSHLMGVIEEFIHAFFGPDIPVRFRPSFFPFTEPSAEVDMLRRVVKREGDRVSESEAWTEIMGCGMVDPEVFKAVGYDPEVWTGFAFGMGVERLAMIRSGITDIRLFFENDIRFLSQLG